MSEDKILQTLLDKKEKIYNELMTLLGIEFYKLIHNKNKDTISDNDDLINGGNINIVGDYIYENDDNNNDNQYKFEIINNNLHINLDIAMDNSFKRLKKFI